MRMTRQGNCCRRARSYALVRPSARAAVIRSMVGVARSWAMVTGVMGHSWEAGLWWASQSQGSGTECPDVLAVGEADQGDGLFWPSFCETDEELSHQAH